MPSVRRLRGNLVYGWRGGGGGGYSMPIQKSTEIQINRIGNTTIILNSLLFISRALFNLQHTTLNRKLQISILRVTVQDHTSLR